jgi:LAO/AO transport system kinase
MRAPPDPAALAAALRRGDRRALARAITLVESTRAEDRAAAEKLLALLPSSGDSLRLGISGSPGVGKSTFIEAFGLTAIRDGRRVAVLAVDPTSQRSGGSILGDKTRMPELAKSDRAFVRPSPAGRTLGGVARRTRETILLAEAARFDLVIVETVGVGQSETAVADMTDLFLVLIAPGSGDELQGIKRGITELADLLIVNKADGDLEPAAKRAVADYRHALRLLRPRAKSEGEMVVAVSALKGRGIAELWRQVVELGAAGRRRRPAQARAALWQEIGEGLLEALKGDAHIAPHLAAVEARVTDGSLTPTAAAREVLEEFLARRR